MGPAIENGRKRSRFGFYRRAPLLVDFSICIHAGQLGGERPPDLILREFVQRWVRQIGVLGRDRFGLRNGPDDDVATPTFVGF